MNFLVRAAMALLCTSCVAFAQNLPSLPPPPPLPPAFLESFGSSAMQSMSSTSDHGRTAGSFGVSLGGAATFSIPIWTPPGPNGVQPSISLNYSSQAGNGLAGAGWTVSAVSSIERCPRTFAQDGDDGAVALAMYDRFCIGGNKLRLSSGTYGSAGSVYFTEYADYSRITAYGTSGNGPQYFVVEAKSGLKYEFGNTTSSRVVLGGTALRWMLNKVYDRSGNSYVISYNSSTGFAVPDAISWTPTSLGESSYLYEAKFNYVNTRSDEDSYFGWVAGYQVVSRYRLENIQIKSAGVVKRKYRLTYNTSSVTLRSRLATATECADDAETNCFLPLTFTYQAGQAGLTAGTGTPPTGSSNNLFTGRNDFNGDGAHDLAYWNGNTWSVALSNGMGFSTPYSTGLSAANALVGDFLPNGRASFIASISGYLWSYRWDDATSAFVAFNTGIASALPATSLDFTGDGLGDLVYFISGQQTLTVRYNNSTGSGDPSFSDAFTTAPLSGNKIYGGVYNFGYNNIGFPRADTDGDGRQDLNVQIVYTGPGGGSTSATILLGSLSGFAVPPEAQWVPGGAPVQPALDFNGDLCADRLVSGTIKISACSGVAASSIVAPGNPIQLMDWDADGKSDLLVDNGGTFGIYKSTGSGFSSLIPTGILTCSTCFVLDQDGDGLDDLVKTNGTSAINYWTHTPTGSVSTYATNVPDLLSNVTDGFGVSHAPDYVSTAWSNYEKGAVTDYPLQEANSEIVVARLTATNGIGGTFTKAFHYVGDRVNAFRGEAAGFQRLDVTDGRNGIISRTHFSQAFPTAGMVSQVEVMQPGGSTTISREVFNNAYFLLDATTNNHRYIVTTLGSTATQYEVGGSWNGVLLRTVATSKLVDHASGTVYDQTVTTTEPASGANGVHAGGTWTARTYSPIANILNDTANWCIGRPQLTQAINSSNLTYGTPITRTTSTDWNPAFCRPTQVIDEPGSGTLQVTTDIEYDSFGNVDETTVTGVGMNPRSTVTVYSDSTFTSGQFPLSVINALGQETTFSWNYDLGLPLGVTDPNSIETSWDYDDFGRRTAEVHPDGTSTTWEYLQCSSCDSRVPLYIDKRERVAGGTAFHIALQYFDQFDRRVRHSPRWPLQRHGPGS